MPAPVQIPADVDREDRILGELTARQVAILGGAAVLAYLAWVLIGPTHLLWCLAALVPVTVAAVALAFGSRDGLSLDRVLWAALVQRAETPTLPGTRPTENAQDPDHPDDTDADVGHDRGRRRRPPSWVGRVVRAPAAVRGVRALSPHLGVLDLGGQGLALVCSVTPIHLPMRTEPEQADALAGFARWLHALAAPVQIVSRTRPLDLDPVLADLYRRAARLPHPALADAAYAHAAHLAAVAATTELTTHEHLLVLRHPTPARTNDGGGSGAPGPVGLARATRTAVETLCRRADEAAALLDPLGLRVTVLDAPSAARVVRAATRPADPLSGPAPLHPAEAARDWAPDPRPAPPPPPPRTRGGPTPGGTPSPTRAPSPGWAPCPGWDEAPTVELDRQPTYDVYGDMDDGGSEDLGVDGVEGLDDEQIEAGQFRPGRIRDALDGPVSGQGTTR
ncbi:PrgI family protein [Pseudonocardia sp. HH130630-07]|uniref:PrgI family protein n=1 Tax=Pseudonocardia sp. HH130630-07 TaxID=1690815 RepID=UPI000814C34B|nr:PrgI family protein [Pseudonocardia sp. HH130630-07]ANY07801.1 hypothetical protein AFB00_17550 [Pseudonocardia sp. HH130630-07]